MPRKGGSVSLMQQKNEKIIQHSTSDKMSICTQCGHPFAQIWRPEYEAYTSFKTCGTCRMANARGGINVTADYTPHWGQQLVHDSTARFKVLNCLPAGEFILGANKPIEDVVVGDCVFGNNGLMNKVYRKIENDYDGHLHKINARYILPFEVTDEHPILLTKVTRNDNFEAFKKARRSKKTIWSTEESIWVNACDVETYLNQQTNYVKWCLKIPRVHSINNVSKWKMRELKTCKEHYKPRFPINEDTAWLLGLFLAEGSTCSSVAQYSLGTHEKDYIKRVKDSYENLGYSVYVRDNETNNSTSLNVCSTALAELFARQFDTNAKNKQIPQDILLHKDRNIILNFLKGYFDGDGHFNKNQLRIYGKTASRKLAYQLQILLARLGYPSYIHENIREKSSIRGREINNENPFYMVVCSSSKLTNELGYSTENKHIREFAFVKEDAIYVPLVSVTKREYHDKVYNLSTDDETFLISNIVSHNCGNRWGKDRCSIMEGISYFIQCLNEDRDNSMVPHALWWVIAPVDKLANQNWRELMANLPKEIVVDISKTTKTIETVNGGIIEVHSAYDPESLVGVGLDLVTITEAARIADMEDVWDNIEARLNSPGRGLNGKGGVGLINSSPLGTNYFYKMWKWGQKGTSDWDPDWESWTFTTWDNPYMAVRGDEVAANGKPYRENLRRRMSKNKYEQNYLAKFLAKTTNVFPNYDKVLKKVPDHLITDEQINEYWREWEEPEPFERYTLGYDPASKNDGKPVVIRNSKGKVMKIDPMIALGWDAQWDRVAFYSRLYNGAHCNFGQTGVGETISSQLTKRGVPNTPIPEQGRNKERLVEDFAVVVEQQYCEIPWSQEAENQLKDYIAVNRNGQSTQYHNGSDSDYDDIVSSLYFCFSDFETPAIALPWVGIMSGINRAG